MSTTHEHTIDTMQLEERRYPPPADFAAQANAQADVYEQDFERFWDEQGRGRVSWFEDYSELYQWQPPYAKWYLGGRLNACFNCVDRHVEGGRATGSPSTGRASPRATGAPSPMPTCSGTWCGWANALQAAGRREGHRVAIYMGMVPELPSAMLACARHGRAAHGGVRRLLGRTRCRPASNDMRVHGC